ncbi:MAG: hypothetical protein HY319_16065 [Armatimonadetes bacterium]|nr:hypothetical protein [Armatimonadota bacterium]
MTGWRFPLILAVLLGCTATLTVAQSGPPQKILHQWITEASVGKPRAHSNLAIYPVTLASTGVPDALTLDKAIQAGALQVGEVSDSGSVNTLVLQNRGKQPVFIMAGEILSGAKQDRVLQHAIWLEPGGGKVDVGAFCVEQGRWSYQTDSKHFQTKETLSNIAVRAEARAAKSQGGVWSKVAETQDALEVAAPTQSLNAAYEDRKVQANINSYTEAFEDMVTAHPKMNGVIIQIGDQMVAVDAFSRRDLLAELWPKMIKSYALEASSRGGGKVATDVDRASRFLLRAATAEPTRQPNPGQGALLELSSDGISGEALVLDKGVAHLELFSSGTRSSQVVPIQRRYR